MDGEAQFREKVLSLKNHDWPYPIVEFYLGATDEHALMAAANAGSTEKKEGFVCEANAYIAALVLTRQDPAKARKHFTQALAECPQAFLERLMAKREMKRFGYGHEQQFAHSEGDTAGKSTANGDASR